MSSEHPFAPFVRILGKGPNLSRPLTRQEAFDAATMILADQVEPEQLGAFLCLLRVKTETAAELAGFAEAIRAGFNPVAGPPVDLDWPSYAGKARRAPLFILAALLLAQMGLKVAMHGAEPHSQGRIFTENALAAIGITASSSRSEAVQQLRDGNFTYLPMRCLHPRLDHLMSLKWLLGLRSPLHSVIRHLNPFDAGASLISVFHPNYRAVHRDAAALMGQRRLACFKGDGGEVERRVEKPTLLQGLWDGEAFEEEWPALIAESPAESDLDPAFLAALWRGEIQDATSEAIIVGTAAIGLRMAARAAGIEEAEAMARQGWRDRLGMAR